VEEARIDGVPIQIIDQEEHGAVIVAPYDFQTLEVF
jgi:hypothetical protein